MEGNWNSLHYIVKNFGYRTGGLGDKCYLRCVVIKEITKITYIVLGVNHNGYTRDDYNYSLRGKKRRRNVWKQDLCRALRLDLVNVGTFSLYDKAHQYIRIEEHRGTVTRGGPQMTLSQAICSAKATSPGGQKNSRWESECRTPERWSPCPSRAISPSVQACNPYHKLWEAALQITCQINGVAS